MLLATVELAGLALGETVVTLGATPDDLTEGLALCEQGLASVIWGTGCIIVVPEPAALSLLAFCGILALPHR